MGATFTVTVVGRVVGEAAAVAVAEGCTVGLELASGVETVVLPLETVAETATVALGVGLVEMGVACNICCRVAEPER